MLYQRNHRLGEILFGVAPASSFETNLQGLHSHLGGDIIGIGHIKVVRSEKSRDLLLDDFIDDFVQFLFRIARVLLERLELSVSKLYVVVAGFLP